MKSWMLAAAAVAIFFGVLLALVGVPHVIATAIIGLTFGILVGVFQNRRLHGPDARRKGTTTFGETEPPEGNQERFWGLMVRVMASLCTGTFLFISSRLIVASFEVSGRYVMEGLGWAAAFAAVPFLIRLEGVAFGKAVSIGWRAAVSRYPWIERGIPGDLPPASFAVAPSNVRGRDRLTKAKLTKGVPASTPWPSRSA